MKTHDLAINAAHDALAETYSKIFGKMWVNTIGPAMDFKITNDGEREVIRSTDGFVELQVEKTNSIGKRTAWNYHVYAVFNDDIGETHSSFSPNLASYKFIEIHLSMRLACMHNLPAER
jgi:hypothetical protein